LAAAVGHKRLLATGGFRASISAARVSMPKSPREFVKRCGYYVPQGRVAMAPAPLPG